MLDCEFLLTSVCIRELHEDQDDFVTEELRGKTVEPL